MIGMYGYAGKLLFVDLTDRTCRVEKLSEADARNFIGGPALGAKILFDRMPAHTDVFAPESMIGFVTGPANGNAAFLGGRYTVVSKSPVTDGWNDSSSGGNFGARLKKAGFDGVFVSGIAETPVYIYVEDGRAEIRDASHLWGLTTTPTEKAIWEEVGDPKAGIALIGPGGEHLSYMAAIMNDTHRAAGRGGSGAVMGSKKLKALVVRGSIATEVADKAKVVQVNKDTNEWMHGPVQPVFDLFTHYGTGGSYDSSVISGDGSVRNWRGTAAELTEEQLSALTSQVMDKLYRKKKFACNACPVGCGAIYSVNSEKYDLSETGRPEYETMGMFGSIMLCSDPVILNECNWLCNEYGLDTISAGATIAWLADAYAHGEFSLEELDGVDLKFGDPVAMRTMLEKMCFYEGIGKILLNGSRYAARHFGKGFDCLAEAGGIELPQHDSRWSTGLARTYKYDPTPGRHVKGGLSIHYGNEPPEVRFNYTNTGERDVRGVVDQEIINAAGFCTMTDFGHPARQYVNYLDAICGYHYTEEEVDKLGARLFAIRHAFNLREGFRRKDATLSPRMEGKPPMTEGPNAGVTVDTEMMADNFYRVLGWDIETAMIPKDVLESYGGMESVIRALYPEEQAD
ncbi:MAG: aldehyde ferredoxin oxidoreductase family protein [Oscillospiraceae bacterium]|nr:aldehyde ferredoxin oxidoreductase family protein [Oscillospiraceae bacterium]